MKILFFLHKAKENKYGSMPITVLLTVSGNQAQFSTGYRLKASEFDAEKQIALGQSKEIALINAKISELKAKFDNI